MPHDPDSLLAFVDYLRTKNPELLKILCSRTDEEFDEGLEGILEQAADHLEKNATHLTQLGEETISAFLVAYLCSPGLRAIQEAHSNGHVDITIEAEHAPPLRRRLGEAKIYSGPTYHVQGLKQLIDRYTTGREGSGFIVEYVKNPKIKELVTKVRSHMDSNKPCSQDGTSQNHRIRWAFTTKHQHSSGEFLRVLHLNCNLHRPGGQ
jgi:hypothetical protein